jgi:hypothetical protein
VTPPISKVVDLCEHYKFVKVLMSWFGLVSDIQGPEVRYPETETEFQLANRLKLVFPGTIPPKTFRTR